MHQTEAAGEISPGVAAGRCFLGVCDGRRRDVRGNPVAASREARGEIVSSQRPPRRRPPRNDVARVCWLMEAATAAAFAVAVDEVRAPSRRSAAVAFARQSAMYLAHVVLRLDFNATGRLFQRDRTTAAHACRIVEQRRDEPAIDRLLDALESVCAELASTILDSPRVKPGARPQVRR